MQGALQTLFPKNIIERKQANPYTAQLRFFAASAENGNKRATSAKKGREEQPQKGKERKRG